MSNSDKLKIGEARFLQIHRAYLCCYLATVFRCPLFSASIRQFDIYNILNSYHQFVSLVDFTYLQEMQIQFSTEQKQLENKT